MVENKWTCVGCKDENGHPRDRACSNCRRLDSCAYLHDFYEKTNKILPLIKDKSLPPILAVDFDGTIVEDKFPDIGPIIPSTIRLIYEYRKRGYKIVLWTCRTKERLEEAVNFCNCLGIDFDAVNDNIPEVVAKYNDNARKIYANVYLDDKNLSLEGAIKDGEPCSHKGCLSHLTHPCEVCGRIAGRGEYHGELRECKQAGGDILGRSYAAIFWKSGNALLKKIFDLA